jgi:hypothetical protein
LPVAGQPEVASARFLIMAMMRGRCRCRRAAGLRARNAILELAAQLVAARIERVVIESTSDYVRHEGA